MATRSTIAVLHESGRVSQIYCHWDGYLDGVGATLTKYYNTLEKAAQLMELGALSSLGERLEPIGEHSFREPEQGTTIAYIRDLGEDSVACRASRFDDLEMYRLAGDKQEFNYLFKDDRWYYRLPEWKEFVELLG